MSSYLPIQFEDGTLKLLDQRKLPLEEVFVVNENLEDGFKSIKDMVVRGAPCIGFTAIFTMALWAKDRKNITSDLFNEAADYLNTSRPTAVNLSFELENCKKLVKKCLESNRDVYTDLVEFGNFQIKMSEQNNLQMAKFVEGDLHKRLKTESYRVLTHCNTGFLACGSIGTALGVIEHLNRSKKIKHVWVDETRPYLQGSRLTAYELEKLGIEHNIVVEGSASHLMKNNLVDFVVVGADRIVKNGDTANKIGTSNLSILAKHYQIPFYVIAPSSSFDMELENGDGIEIELRPEEEITMIAGKQISPLKSKAYNPSFDITSGDLITAISCEKGIVYPPYSENLKGVITGE